MHLKSLTLKGFKSFASSTTLKLEPGICAVVGPNGSGKSNVVDALAWVMGEQGAKTLRGGKMEDVIFAGAGDRKPLGRAEVTLTIDNSDGKLPIEYSEVSVTRRMFRDGASEYEINGAKARLMDIQELLSDSGIGREMHVIVGQGRLSQILESKPEERRAFIEEAAGVLKHRRRKEKAQRKLVGMQSNLDRLQDLTAELRKQLGPLARQAEAAQRASSVQATIRSAKISLAAHQMRALSTELADATSYAQQTSDALAGVQAMLEEHTAELAGTEEELRTALEEAENARTLWYRLSAIAEKNQATLRIATDRAQAIIDEPWNGPDPAELLQRAEEADARQAELDEHVSLAVAKLEASREHVAECEEIAQQAEAEHLAQVRAIADRREGVVRLLAQQEAATARRETAEADVARLSEELALQQESLDTAATELAEAQEDFALHSHDGDELEEATAQADKEVADAEARVNELRDTERATERAIAQAEAKISAWQDRLRPAAGAQVITDTADALGITAAPLGTQITVAAGWDHAVAAALGLAATDGVVAEYKTEYLQALQDAASGRAMLLSPSEAESWRLQANPDAGQWLLDLMEIPANLVGAITSLLVDVVAVENVEEARRVVSADRRLRAVTRQGAVFGEGWVIAGRGAASPVELAAEVERTTHEVEKLHSQLADHKASLDGAIEAAADRRTAAAKATAAVQEHRARRTGAQQRVSAAENTQRAAQRSVERATTQLQQAEQRLAAAVEELAELSDRLSRVDAPDEPQEPSTVERDRATLALNQAKAVETEARLELRTAEERAGAGRGKADNLRRQARQEEAARKQHHIARARKAAKRKIAQDVQRQAQRVGQRIDDALARAQEQRTLTEESHRQWQHTMGQQKQQVSALNAQAANLTQKANDAQLARDKAQLKLEQATENAMEQLAMTPQQLLEQELPPDFDASATRAELKQAEKDLSSLGKVNPLALEEYKALEERYEFLATQLEDVEQARRDLNDVIEDVDATILQLFTDAWRDVEAEFPKVFATLFPGGAGRLVLTEPGDMLTTGIEVEARPPGKKVKRLTLLSGGEKSLTALAMLVAIFRARPSPFYVMDEVEAALDDVNLRRLIALFEELRKDSQLIVITHQKPTMDVANVLYGVTMRGDGVTRVISQRMQRAE